MRIGNYTIKGKSSSHPKKIRGRNASKIAEKDVSFCPRASNPLGAPTTARMTPEMSLLCRYSHSGTGQGIQCPRRALKVRTLRPRSDGFVACKTTTNESLTVNVKDRLKTPAKLLPVLQRLLLTAWEKMRDDLGSWSSVRSTRQFLRGLSQFAVAL